MLYTWYIFAAAVVGVGAAAATAAAAASAAVGRNAAEPIFFCGQDQVEKYNKE